MRSTSPVWLKLVPFFAAALLALSLFSLPRDVGAADRVPKLPAGFKESVYATGIFRASAMAFSPDGRLFVAERRGPEGESGTTATLQVVKNGKPNAEPFLRVPVAIAGERGLIGFTFDPKFESNGYVYIYYTYTGSATEKGLSRISRFTASKSNPDVAEPGSELVIMDNIPNSQNHNGGMLRFGPDGKMYFGIGDNNVRESSQSLEVLTGKIHRIDPVNYPNIVPSDNPYVNTPGVRPEIWAYGLRNPFTFAIDSVSGRFLVNDVGEANWEFIHELKPKTNYGWPKCEGGYVFKGGTTPCGPEYAKPIYVYPHPSNPVSASATLTGCSIIGGAFYHGNQFPSEYKGSYFFTDFCGPWIARLTSDNKVEVFARDTDQFVTNLTIGPDGSVYYLGFVSGVVYKISYAGGAQGANPTPTAAPKPTEAAVTPSPGGSQTPSPTATSGGQATPAPTAATPTGQSSPTPTTAPASTAASGPSSPSQGANQSTGPSLWPMAWIALALLPPGMALVQWGLKRRRGTPG